MSLSQTQRIFTRNIGCLINYAYDVLEIEMTFGEAHRTNSQMLLNYFGYKVERGGSLGIRLVKSTEDVRQAADQMLGATLVTHQTGEAGKEVKRVYIEDGCDIARELYLSLLVDRETSRVTVIASSEGGMDIEEVAAKTPEKIMTVDIDPLTGMQGYHARRIAFGLGLEGDQVRSAIKFLTSMYRAFTELDASLVNSSSFGLNLGIRYSWNTSAPGTC